MRISLDKIFTLVFMMTLIGAAFSAQVSIPVSAATGDEYFVYSSFDPAGIDDIVGVGGYVEYYGIPDWGDEIQYVYFLSGNTGYKVRVWIIDGDGDGKIDPRQHPDHYLSQYVGPIEPRYFEIVSLADLTGYTSGSDRHKEEFYVDSSGVYLGAYPNGINKWDHDWNYIEKVANSPPSTTESLAYNPAENAWYAGGRYRTIYQLEDTDGDGSFLDETWVSIFTYPDYGGSHNDGLEYVGGYLWISDMTSDVIGKWRYDPATGTWEELNRFTYSEPADVEGMGFGPNDHFWCGSGWGSDSYIYELGNEITRGYPIAEAGSDVDAYPPTVPVEFDASESHHTDPAKEIVLYEWDFESDGTWDYSGTDLIVEHMYPAYYNPDGSIDWDQTAKDYTATLRVRDNSDPPLKDTDTCIVHITAPPWKPVADPDGPYEGYVNAPVQLDGSKSYDPESKMFPSDHPWYETIATYEWDLDYDGEFDDSMDVKPSWTWDNEGLYIVGLKVTDSQTSGPGGTIGPLDVDTKYTTVAIESAPNKYAILVAPVRSDNEAEFKHNIHEMRLILLDSGWTDEKIVFLTRSDISKQETNEPWIDGDATHENVEKALDAIASGGTYQFTQTDGTPGSPQSFEAATESDVVFVELRDHGGQRTDGERPGELSDPHPNDENDGFDGIFCTYAWNDRTYNPENFWYDDEIDAKLDTIQYNKLILLVDACHSGEFIPDCEGTSRLVLTSCAEDETSGRYAYKFYERIRDPGADGCGGREMNGVISCEEAHCLAVSDLTAWWRCLIFGCQHPQMSDNISGEVYLDPSQDYNPTNIVSNPVYEESQHDGSILINEFFYNKSNQQEPNQWIEIYNPTSMAIDISGWILAFDLIDGVNIFPEGTVIESLEYLIVTHDLQAFQEYFTVPPGVTVLDDNAMGNNMGSLSIDTLRLYDSSLKVVDHLDYGDGPGRAPDVEPPNSISRYKESYDTNNCEIDWHVEIAPTPGVASPISVDNTNPITACSPNEGTYSEAITVTLTATDIGSGINKTYYKIGNGEWLQYTAPFNIKEPGDYTVLFYSVDNLGNQEQPNSVSYTIKPPPIPWILEAIPFLGILATCIVALVAVLFFKRRKEYPPAVVKPPTKVARPPRVTPLQKSCPHCHHIATYIPQYGKWYCHRCKRYVE